MQERRPQFLKNTAEVITVGNELLIGKILNTNAQWLCRRITTLGGRITRVTTIPDEVDVIALTIKQALSRKPDFIVTVGGLGPTYDDKTLQGVAKALSQPPQLNRKALRMVEEKYLELSAKGIVRKTNITAERAKMARLPRGANPLFNPVGTAPASLSHNGRTLIISLPGVPSEMRAIFDNSVTAIAVEKFSNLHFKEKSMMVKNVPESELAPLVDEVMRSFPTVYIKSHPKGGGKHLLLELHFSTYGRSGEEARKTVDSSSKMIRGMIRKI